MHDFTVGQRWVSENEAALGLGIVRSVDIRTVQMEFPAADEVRTYAKNNAPLTRVEFDVGDSIASMEGWCLSITRIEQVSSTVRYHGLRDNGETNTIHESELSSEITFNLPQDKLFAGQIDGNKWFELLRENAPTPCQSTNIRKLWLTRSTSPPSSTSNVYCQ